jgi:hypothetical protein
MESPTPCREYIVVGATLFLLTLWVGAFYLWIAVSWLWRSPDPFDDIELAVRDPERAQTELPRDRQLGNSAASLTSEAAEFIT